MQARPLRRNSSVISSAAAGRAVAGASVARSPMAKISDRKSWSVSGSASGSSVHAYCSGSSAGTVPFSHTTNPEIYLLPGVSSIRVPVSSGPTSM